ncbi:hypothetical protein [Actinophytocola gossypii]|uniref:DUF2188 domain-containing protein n=1 Tax=Actinophytocola gossypii TaxID=2812003 RepID=A0ABT2JJJ0_9PSEU|nr:hypothetical protein [Actinophytocola gossypii]MCT2588051.1 hypothetical protein [Actinophytocola gossypii]
MRESIEVNYVPDGDDWQITVTGVGETREATATSLVTAREQAEELVAELVSEEAGRTVVHLLNGDALAFTSAYLSARLARPEESTQPPAPDEAATAEPSESDSDEPSSDEPAHRAPTNQG